MKIFGKRNVVAPPSDGIGGDCNNRSNATISVAIYDDVPSYFADTSSTTPITASTKKKKNQRKDSNNTAGGGGQSQINGEEIQTLLAMDPSTLNAKQRRLVRRHHERDASTASSSVEVESMMDDKTNDNTANERNRPNEGMKNDESSEQNKHTTLPANSDNDEQSVINHNITDILVKLEGLNSKDRRKLLRQLKTSSGGTIDESVIAAAEEKARTVAERNEKEAANNNNNMADKKSMDKPTKKRKNSDTKATCTTPSIVEVSKATTRKRRKKGPPINLADLSPEERKRREEQRLSQQHAAERRAAGLIDPDRHPLNSERRRANRRKPGKAALIAQAKKEQLAEKGKFNAFGYQKRKGGAGSGSS
jgi:hypothetical protein